MASAVDEFEDEFGTCSICMVECNEGTREPKLLPCSHTVCLCCLQGIFRDNAIACPYCRQSLKLGGHLDVKKLPNNKHALHILKLKLHILKLNQQIAGKVESVSSGGMVDELDVKIEALTKRCQTLKQRMMEEIPGMDAVEIAEPNLTYPAQSFGHFLNQKSPNVEAADDGRHSRIGPRR